MKQYAVFIDTISIQTYIFSSNRLREHIGASFNVETLYDSIDCNKYKCKEGYIGGGNALFFFEDEKQATDFIKNWSAKLLTEYPGIRVAFAVNEYDPSNHKDSMGELAKQMRENKYKFSPIVTLPHHGITATCNRSDHTAEVYFKDFFIHEEEDDKDENEGYVSSISMSKIHKDTFKDAKAKIKSSFGSIIGDDFCFSNRLDKLGQTEGEKNYIAVVHIDGNSMGKKFQACTTLKETKQLSKDVDRIVEESFGKLLEHIVDNNRWEEIAKTIKPEKAKNGKTILPIRPIVLSGDDITFVSEGRLGIYFAHKLLEYLEEYKINEEKFTACAGVSIVKTNFPFYKAYTMAEEACKIAKDMRKDKNDDGSWLDFHLHYGGYSGTLKEIRKKHFIAPQGNLLFRPYRIGEYDDSYFSFDLILKDSYKLKEQLPTSKLHELREILNKDQSSEKLFLETLKSKGKELRKFKFETNNPNSLFFKVTIKDKTFPKTHFFDMIELSEFYPDFGFEELPKGENK